VSLYHEEYRTLKDARQAAGTAAQQTGYKWFVTRCGIQDNGRCLYIIQSAKDIHPAAQTV
jgi:hypothetical protein